MRLLNTNTLRLETWMGTSAFYAILSHTWEEDEVLFADICDPQKPLPFHKKGFRKVRDSCERARQDGYQYLWIDTCCIDKSSSAELSEAINSMFRWYHQADKCYAFLSDVNSPQHQWLSRFEDSRWFTRGWTLQELIAPIDVRFYDSQWVSLGTREDLAERISEKTTIPVEILRWYTAKLAPTNFGGIPKLALNGTVFTANKEPAYPLEGFLDKCSVAQRFSWAAHRQTTRIEDQAYSLMGLFGVNMPMLYGEGRHAFIRLQHEIMKSSDDYSILAFDHHLGQENRHLLADSPRCFESSEIRQSNDPRLGPVWPGAPNPSCQLVPASKAVDIDVLLCPLTPSEPVEAARHPEQSPEFLAVLQCVYKDDFTSHPALTIKEADRTSRSFYRVFGPGLVKISPIDHQGSVQTVAESTELRFDYSLSKAIRSTIRLFLLPSQASSALQSPLRNGPTNPTPGIRIRFDSKHGLLGQSSYPHSLEVQKGCVYAPSMLLPEWPSRFSDGVYLFGVVILQFDIGFVAVSWGRRPEYNIVGSPDPWCAIMDWQFIEQVIPRIEGENVSQYMDRVAGRLYMMNDQNTINDSVNWTRCSATPPALHTGTIALGLRVECRVRTIDFFGRPILDAELALANLIFVITLELDKFEQGRSF
ncbi:putative vegetative incompatibility protein HET-E-1 [Podospora australis]|uniref:Vegetative incompatibility protein HET-E-1 n=1 Tax=Podospora australis TaxID=1536484 RepID=A0AAN6WHX6_9PEZI|nr:putative vegetative incompatibility protein HET-E-1 [Podospora australis]